MHAPPDDQGFGAGGNDGFAGASGSGGQIPTGGTTGSGGATGSGGKIGTAGATGAGGGLSMGGTTGSGGATGTGGGLAAGGTTGTGGAPATGGAAGGASGANGSGGLAGNGNAGGNGLAGTTGSGGAMGSGGVTGTGGTAGTTGSGGAAGAAGGAGTGGGGAAGAGGAGGAGGTGGYTCHSTGVLDCSTSGALPLTPDGQVTTFSPLEWNGATSTWCDIRGLEGRVFSYSGASPSASTVSVDTTAQNLKLDLTVGANGYAGGGLLFDSCVNASAFTSVQFSGALTTGSLTGCWWQVQLQTQDQKSSADTNPSGGTCNPNGSGGCYRYPAVANLAAPAAGGTSYSEAFTSFNNPASSSIATAKQVTGIQWQVNSTNATGNCTVELRIDAIKFQ